VPSVEEWANAIAVGIFFALVFVLGERLFRRLAGRLDARLGARWWLTLPVVAIISFAGFLMLQPLVVDQPRTPLWFVLGFVAIALLVAGGTALGYAVVALGKWFLAVLLGR
jgi:nitrate/nitrite transporter NarK